MKVKTDGRALQGYRREHLWDAFTRYLDPVATEAEPPEPLEPGMSEASSEVPLASEVPEPTARTEPANPHLTSIVPEVPKVPDLRQERRCRDCGQPIAARHTLCAGCFRAIHDKAQQEMR